MYGTDYGGSGGPPHPLAEYPPPDVKPGPLRTAQHNYDPYGRELGEETPAGLRRAAGDTVGSAWLGKASAHCGEAVDGLAAGFSRNGGNADTAAAALKVCADQWDEALYQYQVAEVWARRALEEEARHRAKAYDDARDLEQAGQPEQAAQVRAQAVAYRAEWERNEAQRLARQAIDQVEQAGNKLARELESATETMGQFTRAFSYQGSPMLQLLPNIANFSERDLRMAQRAQQASGLMANDRYTQQEMTTLSHLLRNADNAVFASTVLHAMGPRGCWTTLPGCTRAPGSTVPMRRPWCPPWWRGWG